MRIAKPATVVGLLAFGSQLGCGGNTTGDARAGAAGSAELGAAGGGGGTPPSCALHASAGAPTISSQCEIVARSIDPVSTCGSDACPITKALELVCQISPDHPSVAAAADGALVLAAADGIRLMTVETTASRVEDVPFFKDPSPALAAIVPGATWLFGGDPEEVVGARAAGAGWMASTIVALPETGAVHLTDVSMANEGVGYLTYYTDVAGQLPNRCVAHLATWDGSCWSDQSLGTSVLISLVVRADADTRPWVVWGDSAGGPTQTIRLRSPDGSIEDLFTGVPTPLLFGMASTPPRLLPGGLDGKSSFPVIAVKHSDGIRVATHLPGWSEAALAGSADGATSGDCPEPIAYHSHACDSLTSCTEQVSGASTGFDLVRTWSGATFAAWVVYSSTTTYALEEGECLKGEMPICYCFRTPTSTSGTADLVIVRLGESQLTSTRFHFGLDGVLNSVAHDVVMAARGDTLLVAATLSGGAALSYLEIDSGAL